MFLLFANLKYFSMNIRRKLFFPWSVLDYSKRDKPRYKYKMFFLKTTYYTIFYVKHSILTFLLWPFLLRRIKCSEKNQFFLKALFAITFTIWCLGFFIAYVLMMTTKWFEIFIFFPLMRIVYLILFEGQYRKNKKMLFRVSSKQELLDFNGDNMHKPEKSFLTYKESYQYGWTYKKFTIPVFCSSPAIDLNYELFDINEVDSYQQAKEKLIEVLGDDFFVFLEQVNVFLEKSNQFYYISYEFKNAISIIYTLIKRLDYNYIFLYFIPYLFGCVAESKVYTASQKNKINPHFAMDKYIDVLLEEANRLMRGYLEKGLYIINPIFKQEDNLKTYQEYVVEKNDEVKEIFFNEIFYYQLLISELKNKYYFHSSDGKIDFTHPFLPIFFFRYSFVSHIKNWSKEYPRLTGLIISNYNVIDLFFFFIINKTQAKLEQELPNCQ